MDDNAAAEPLSQDLINEFVIAAHGDEVKVREMLAEHPDLLQTSAIWTETAVEAASQMGHTSLINFLIEKGAPVDICTAAVLGRHDKVRQFLAQDPANAQATGAHGIPVLYFPAI